MKNITVSIDDETYRQARVKAAENGTSVSALVRGFLEQVDGTVVLVVWRGDVSIGQIQQGIRVGRPIGEM